MPRLMSFALTERQLMSDGDDAKDITRRLGWISLKPGDAVGAVRKAMGLKKGEQVVRLCTLRIVSVRREPLDAIDQNDVRREGFPEMTPTEFVAFFCRANKCAPDAVVTRIEFRREKTATP